MMWCLQPEHPHPGQSYEETSQKILLTKDPNGIWADGLLSKAFHQRLLFVVTEDNKVVWDLTQPSKKSTDTQLIVKELKERGIS